jgi:hypothetical protein
MRVRERMQIHRIMRGNEDIMFPKEREVSDVWNTDSDSVHRYSKKEIRDGYMTEINCILNNSNVEHVYASKDGFLLWFNIIRGKEKHVGGRWLEWLENKEIKNVIKKWKGKPLDVLYYLVHSGLIEKAVLREINVGNSK